MQQPRKFALDFTDKNNYKDRHKTREGRLPDVTSKTKQSFKASTRIDNVLKKYGALGVDANNVGLFQQHVAQMPYGVQPDRDYQQQLNKVIRAKEYFDALPSAIREKFRHDPANMIAFMADPKNAKECMKLGLFSSPEPIPGSERKTEKDTNEKKDDAKATSKEANASKATESKG